MVEGILRYYFLSVDFFFASVLWQSAWEQGTCWPYRRLNILRSTRYQVWSLGGIESEWNRGAKRRLTTYSRKRLTHAAAYKTITRKDGIALTCFEVGLALQQFIVVSEHRASGQCLVCRPFPRKTWRASPSLPRTSRLNRCHWRRGSS